MEKVTQVTEDQLQAKFYQYCYNTYPQIRGLLFSVPNGGTRNIIEAIKLKSTGLTPGIPDMLLLWGGKVYGLEFKTEAGILSSAQIKIHDRWRVNGIRVEVIRSFEQGITIFESIING